MNRKVSEGIRFSVLDLGSGPGTGGLAVLDWIHRYHSGSAGNLSVVAVDTSGTALRQAERLWDAYNRTAGISGPRLKTYEANLERALKGSLGEEIRRAGPYDLIILANCLNEMWSESSDPTAARAGLITAALVMPFAAWHRDDRGTGLAGDVSSASSSARPVASRQTLHRLQPVSP